MKPFNEYLAMTAEQIMADPALYHSHHWSTSTSLTGPCTPFCGVHSSGTKMPVGTSLHSPRASSCGVNTHSRV